MTFNRVSVWLDAPAPTGAAFAFAREWAERLRRPLHPLPSLNKWSVASGQWPVRPNKWSVASGQWPVKTEEDGKEQEPLGSSVFTGPWPLISDWPLISEETAAPDLHVFGRSLPKRSRADIVRRAARDRAAFLNCPDEWQPLARALVLHDESDSAGSFLSDAVRTCAALQVRTVVLTVARSDRVARHRREQAQKILAAQGRDCVFDQFAGLSVRPAVHLLACWRRCQVVVLQRRPERLWWPLRSGDTLEQLTARPSPLAFLALPPAPPLLS